MNHFIAAASSSAHKPMVDWVGLSHVLLASIGFAIGIVIVLSCSVALWATAEGKSGAARGSRLIGATLGALLIVGAVVFGVLVMMNKPH